jgi:hypothetical protein
MKTAAFALILLAASGAALGQAPATAAAAAQAGSGRPQVTMFMHQTLGESWEDFLRITGINVSACLVQEKPLPAQWCETFKKIEAGENAAVTDNSGGKSASLVFSEKKLVQVLVQGKAEWTASLAEFTQKYGAPDTQAANSATWSFADGGGITASAQPGNLVTARFYSKDGKEEKAPAPAATLASVATPATNTAPTAYKNFVLGASIDDMIAAGFIRVDLCAGKPKGDMKRTCKDFERVKSGASVGIQIENSEAGRVSLHFDNRKLMHVNIDPSISSSFAMQVALLTQKFGAPTTLENTVQANVLGGRWECGDARWERFDGATIAVHEWIEMLPITGPTRAVMVVFTAKEQVEKERADYAAKQLKY